MSQLRPAAAVPPCPCSSVCLWGCLGKPQDQRESQVWRSGSEKKCSSAAEQALGLGAEARAGFRSQDTSPFSFFQLSFFRFLAPAGSCTPGMLGMCSDFPLSVFSLPPSSLLAMLNSLNSF